MRAPESDLQREREEKKRWGTASVTDRKIETIRKTKLIEKKRSKQRWKEG